MPRAAGLRFFSTEGSHYPEPLGGGGVQQSEKISIGEGGVTRIKRPEGHCPRARARPLAHRLKNIRTGRVARAISCSAAWTRCKIHPSAVPTRHRLACCKARREASYRTRVLIKPYPARSQFSIARAPSSELTRGHRRLSRRRRTRPGSCPRRPRLFFFELGGLVVVGELELEEALDDAEDDAEDDQGALPKATAGGRADLRPDSSGASGADRRRIPFLPGPNQVPYRPVSFQSIFIQSGYCRGGGGAAGYQHPSDARTPRGGRGQT